VNTRITKQDALEAIAQYCLHIEWHTALHQVRVTDTVIAVTEPFNGNPSIALRTAVQKWLREYRAPKQPI
jgi:hypothetical protein